MKRRDYVYVVEIVSDGGNEIEVYARKADAERREAEVRREARRDDDFDTRAISWKAYIR